MSTYIYIWTYIHTYLLLHILFWQLLFCKICSLYYLFICRMSINHLCPLSNNYIIFSCLICYLYKDTRCQSFTVQFFCKFFLCYMTTLYNLDICYIHITPRKSLFVFHIPYHLYILVYLCILKCSQHGLIVCLIISTLDEFLDSSVLNFFSLK